MPADQALIDRLLRPLKTFLMNKLAGACLLLAMAIVALIWANSSFYPYYYDWLHIKATLALGEYGLSKSIGHWINDGLMGIFFFVVGLEIKREFLAGELANPRQAAFSIFAALGGMVMPALIYLLLNPSGEAFRGWGIPMATDIAFALGVLALFPVSISLKVFLTALAIVDDIGAIIVVAIFYTDAIALQSLVIGGLFLLFSIGSNIAGVRNPVVYFLIGFIVWVAFLKSGVHATLAAVLMAFTIPSRTRIDGQEFCEQTEELLSRLRKTGLPQGRLLLSSEQHTIVHSVEQVSEQAIAPLQELEHALMPVVTFVILPLFALANAGVVFAGNMSALIANSITSGIILGLVVGKPLGIWLFSYLAVKVGVAELPQDLNFSQVVGVGMLSGIGFTMALFISTLAFPDESLAEVAKAGVLIGSLTSALIGCTVLYFTTRLSRR